MTYETNQPETRSETMTAADQINSRLRDGGIVQVTTYTRSTLYRQKHAGWFFMDKNNNLMVRSGRKSVCIENTAIRLGWER